MSQYILLHRAGIEMLLPVGKFHIEAGRNHGAVVTIGPHTYYVDETLAEIRQILDAELREREGNQ